MGSALSGWQIGMELAVVFCYQFNVRSTSDLRVYFPKHHALRGAWFARAGGKRL